SAGCSGARRPKPATTPISDTHGTVRPAPPASRCVLDCVEGGRHVLPGNAAIPALSRQRPAEKVKEWRDPCRLLRAPVVLTGMELALTGWSKAAISWPCLRPCQEDEQWRKHWPDESPFA